MLILAERKEVKLEHISNWFRMLIDMRNGSIFIPLLNEHSRQNEYRRFRPTLIIHSGGAVHDYIYTRIVLIELLLHKGHLEPILLLIRCRSGQITSKHTRSTTHI